MRECAWGLGAREREKERKGWMDGGGREGGRIMMVSLSKSQWVTWSVESEWCSASGYISVSNTIDAYNINVGWFCGFKRYMTKTAFQEPTWWNRSWNFLFLLFIGVHNTRVFTSLFAACVVSTCAHLPCKRNVHVHLQLFSQINRRTSFASSSKRTEVYGRIWWRLLDHFVTCLESFQKATFQTTLFVTCSDGSTIPCMIYLSF